MKRRFIVAVQGLKQEQETDFVAYLRKERLGWWHWIANTWLVTTKREDITAADLRDTLREIASPNRCIVIEVTGASRWSGTRDDKDMFDWIRSTWMTDD